MTRIQFFNTRINKVYQENDWSRSHLSCPTPIWIRDEEIVRVYYTSIGDDNQGRVSFYDLNANNLDEVVYDHQQPILSAGKPGGYDDNGVFCVSVIFRDNIYEMYFIGFEVLEKIRYRIFSGCATSADGIHFHRISTTPLLDRIDGQEYFRGGPYVYKVGDDYHMLYVGGGSWVDTPMGLKPEYHIYRLIEESKFTYGAPSLVKKYNHDLDEHGFGRPAYYTIEGRAILFYSTRSLKTGHYRLAGEWLKDNEKINFSSVYTQTKEKHLCYLSPFQVDKKHYCLTNNGNFGESRIYLSEMSVACDERSHFN